MNNPILISEIPLSADYYSDLHFASIYPKAEIDKLTNEIQILDPRLTLLDDIDSVVYPDYVIRLFEIKDMQLSKCGADALCSLSVYRRPSSFDSVKDWSDYLNGLWFWIQYYREVLPSQKLRVYVADDTWDILHEEGVLESRDVDFVRMASSCPNGLVGLFWRYLAFDDYAYPYVYLQELDGQGSVVDGKWKMERDHPLYNFLGTEEQMQSWLGCADGSPACLGGGVGFNGMCENIQNSCQDLNEGSDNLCFFNFDEQCMFISHLACYYLVWAPLLLRGQRRLPVKMFSLICHSWLSNCLWTLYHPKMDKWSIFKDRWLYHHGAFVDETMFFLLTKIASVKINVFRGEFGRLRQVFERYGPDCLFRRLYQQLVVDGNCFEVIGDGEFWGQNEFLDFSDETYDRIVKGGFG